MRIERSATVEEVVAACNDYIGMWRPEEIAELPERFRPRIRIEAQDVNAYALDLIAAEDVGDRAEAPMVHRMSTFFRKAALRLAEIVDAPGMFAARHRASDSRSF